MLAHGPGVVVAEAVVQPLVVGVVEPLLLHRPLEVPIDFGHEAEAGHPLADALRRLGPEERGAAAPGALEHIGQDEHRHVAANAVALAGDPDELADHRLLRRRIAVVELQRVGPAGEIRVAAIGQDADRPAAA